MDRELVEAAQRDDREAFVDLVRPRADRLFAVAHRILRDVDRAEDAFQDALVIAWRDLRSLRDPDRFDAWLQRALRGAGGLEQPGEDLVGQQPAASRQDESIPDFCEQLPADGVI